MGFFDFVRNKNSSELSLEEKLNINLLTDEMQGKLYKEVQNIKYYADKLSIGQSEGEIGNYQRAVTEAFEQSIEIYEWLKEKGIFELNAIVLMASFYLINLSDVRSKDPNAFSEIEITNTVNTFLAALGAQGKVDISSYNGLVKVGISWLLKHPTS